MRKLLHRLFKRASELLDDPEPKYEWLLGCPSGQHANTGRCDCK